MRLRRLELVIIGLTLAFACFIGGYFTGRSSSTVSISPTISQQGDSTVTTAPAPPGQGQGSPGAPDSGAAQQGAEGGAQGSQGATGDAQGSQGSQGEQQSAAQAPTPTPVPQVRDSEGRININLASRSELMDLPGIGPTLSDRIVDYRAANGFFTKIDDLRKVSGIGEKRFETIRDKITVGG